MGASLDVEHDDVVDCADHAGEADVGGTGHADKAVAVIGPPGDQRGFARSADAGSTGPRYLDPPLFEDVQDAHARGNPDSVTRSAKLHLETSAWLTSGREALGTDS